MATAAVSNSEDWNTSLPQYSEVNPSSAEGRRSDTVTSK